MINNPEALRRTINEELSLLADPRFERSRNGEEKEYEYMAQIISHLRDEKAAFFERYSYGWACEVSAYNSSFEMFLQWRLLNVISDIPSDHPALDRCTGLVVRSLPSSCARPYTRHIGNYKVVVLTSGYISALRGFVRLWLRGCALGRLSGRERPKSYKEAGETYLLGLKNNEAAMTQSALAYGGNLCQLLSNEVPFMDRESIFDGKVLTREEHQEEFELLCNAVDGFLLFHEVAHVLNGDSLDVVERLLEVELEADHSSVSLCIIDEARRGGTGTVVLGGPLFFRIELLRLLCEEILETRARRHDLRRRRYPGIIELMRRSNKYKTYVDEYLGKAYCIQLRECGDAFSLVFATVKGAFLNALGKEVALYDYVRTNA